MYIEDMQFWGIIICIKYLTYLSSYIYICLLKSSILFPLIFIISSLNGDVLKLQPTTPLILYFDKRKEDIN